MKNPILFLLGFLFLLINPSFASIKEKNNHVCSVIDTHPKNWKNSEIVKLLKKGKVLSVCPMREHLQSCGKKVEFYGDVYFVELDNGLKAVFKSLPKDDLGDAYAEVAAYVASISLGFPNIPPTVMTTINGMKGSLQLFVETDIDALDPGIYKSALKEAPVNDVANLHLFYFVFGQWDSGPHNILIFKDQEKTYLIAIDNSGIRNHQHVKYGSLPFVRILYSDKLQTNDWDKPFPFEKAKTIENPTTEKMRKAFGNTLPESYYQSFKSYGLPLRYVTYRNSLWRQYHAGDEEFVMSFPNRLPNQTRKALEGLNLPMLKKIFACAKNADFLTPSYLKAILERRDQVLRHF
ncbi:MAG TPA: hypothetical protein VMW10_02210 [Alphaproteobacteria bacterium]|nr:hypothetical protein [Alphaproteobacteria bacterium]